MYREGITRASPPTTSRRPRELGYVVKLLAVAEELDGEVAVRVHPAMVPVGHPLASVRGSFNAVFIEGDAVGELMLYGRGAGGVPDRVARCSATSSTRPRTCVEGRRAPRSARSRRKPIRADRRGRVAVLPARSTSPTGPACSPRSPACSATHDVSIQSMQQKGMGDDARLIFVTHLAREADAGRDDSRRARARRGRPRRLGAARRRGRGVSA